MIILQMFPRSPNISISLQPYSTPPGLLQWFREVLAAQGTAVQLFIDPETDLEVGVFLPTIQQQIANALASCQPTPPLPSSPPPPHPQRDPDGSQNRGLPLTTPPHQDQGSNASQSPDYGSGLDEAAFSQLEQSVHATARVQQIDQRDLVYKSTNKNRTRLRRRAEKEALSRSGNRVSRSISRSNRRPQLSAARRVSDSNSDTAGEGPRAEHRSQVVPRGSLSVQRWFDQVTREHGPMKPSLQVKMKKAAMAIAGRRAVQDWQDFFRCWREKGLLGLG